MTGGIYVYLCITVMLPFVSQSEWFLDNCMLEKGLQELLN